MLSKKRHTDSKAGFKADLQTSNSSAAGWHPSWMEHSAAWAVMLALAATSFVADVPSADHQGTIYAVTSMTCKLEQLAMAAGSPEVVL